MDKEFFVVFGHEDSYGDFLVYRDDNSEFVFMVTEKKEAVEFKEVMESRHPTAEYKVAKLQFIKE